MTTTEPLKRALARMMPPKLKYDYTICSDFSLWNRVDGWPIKDTELLSMVREVELTLSLDELTIYYNILLEICTEVPPLIAPWEKRVEGLAKVKGIEV